MTDGVADVSRARSVARADARIVIESVAILALLALFMWAFSLAVRPGILIPSRASRSVTTSSPSDAAVDRLFERTPRARAIVAPAAPVAHAPARTIVTVVPERKPTRPAPSPSSPPVASTGEPAPSGITVDVAGITLTLPL